jgi:hypothetical protein
MLVFVLTLRAAATAGRAEASMTQHVSPVDKVLELMNALYQQVKDQGKDEAEAYKEFACFCKDTQLGKDKEINDGDDNEDEQLATIEQKTAEKESLSNDIGQLHTDLDDTDVSIEQAAAEREAEKKKFEERHADTIASVEGVRTAISTITEATSLIEKEAVIKSAKVQALLKKYEDEKREEPVGELGAGEKSREHAGLGASASITDVLDMLLQDWTMKAKKMEDEEEARKKLYDNTSAELRQLIIDTKTAIENSKDQLSNTESFLAKTKAQLTETKANLNDDNLYLKDLTAQCELKAKEWDQRSVMRGNELKALEKAIEIVGGSVKDTQGTRGYTDNTELLQGGASPEPEDAYTDVVFVQLKEVKKTRDESRGKQARLDAVTKIKHMAKKLNSIDLNLLAMKIAANPFSKVKELIQQLITRLLTESENEATQKGWCDTELGKANSDRDFRMSDTKKLSAKALVLEAEKKSQEETITKLTAEIAELQADHVQVTQIREKEKAENKKVMEESREGLTALTKALATLKKFYGKASRANQGGYVSFAQVSQTPAEAAMAAAGTSGKGVGNYEGNQAGGQGIIGILEVISSDFKRSISMAEGAEKDSYTQYAAYNKESKASMKSKTEGLDNAQDDLKIASGDLVATLNKLKDNQKLLDMSLMALETLRPACIDTGMSWDEKVKRRDAEIQALKDALEVFEDPNGLGFLQKSQ